MGFRSNVLFAFTFIPLSVFDYSFNACIGIKFVSFVPYRDCIAYKSMFPLVFAIRLINNVYIESPR